jgi:DNA excision repair protein ERCC-4
MEERLKVIIDTREQQPWSFDPAVVDAEIGTLKTGDYSLEGDNQFGIERKSLDDFLGTVSVGWGRFVRELNRMDEAQWVAKTIIVEGDYSTCTFQQSPSGELIPPEHRHYMLTPQFIEKRIAQLTMRNVSVLFAKDAHLAAGLAVAIFKERKTQLS